MLITYLSGQGRRNCRRLEDRDSSAFNRVAEKRTNVSAAGSIILTSDYFLSFKSFLLLRTFYYLPSHSQPFPSSNSIHITFRNILLISLLS